ncbi:MOSC domain-containing protein [Roseovarius sp. SCSIO 43702]|uniref:MOSC domain-containing protein n=1 Tax=Roseovarius sp. SCSIO 43702 TaxID=2823043 RepID=UPI001C737BEE|nr:MOSC domain-containing protein [Roseovarius sp. SCSIO 43702]QYX57449.1 MOSC domain-containing protein [Roseovarius sp. SCSIO 43702]
MSALVRTDFTARITWLGLVPREGGRGIRSGAVERIAAHYAGPEGDRHAGETRPSCVRVKNMHAEGTDIRNVRQFSVLSAEEIRATAEEMGLATLAPEWLGATMVIEGIGDFTHVPPSSRLQAPDGATLVIDMENRPCQYPAREIEADRPGLGKAFLPASRGRRGVTAWVEREGALAVGDELRLFIPDQRPWAHLDETLSADARKR